MLTTWVYECPSIIPREPRALETAFGKKEHVSCHGRNSAEDATSQQTHHDSACKDQDKPDGRIEYKKLGVHGVMAKPPTNQPNIIASFIHMVYLSDATHTSCII